MKVVAVVRVFDAVMLLAINAVASTGRSAMKPRHREEQEPSNPRRFQLTLPLAVLIFIGAACGGDQSDNADDSADAAAGQTETTEAINTSNETSTGDTSVTVCSQEETEMAKNLDVLPVRPGQREETTGSVPHIQLTAEPVPEVDAELRRRAYLLPGMVDRESRLSLPGARSLSLSDDVDAARPEILQAGREFGHIHPDGSMHLWLPVDRAAEVDEAKWGEYHPWVNEDGFWDGVVMVYTPESPDELEVVMRLVADAYSFVTGADVDLSTTC